MKTESIDGVDGVVRQDSQHTTIPEVSLPRFSIPDLPHYLWFLNLIWQGFFTLLHGIARPGDKPLFTHSNVTETLRRIGTFLVGVAVMTGIVFYWEHLLMIIEGLPLFARPFGWIVIIYIIVIGEFVLLCGAVRALQTTIVHEATHGKLCKDKKKGNLVAEWITLLLGTQPFYIYKPEHLIHHEGSSFATMLDADARMFVELLGFKPGQTLSFYWVQLIKAILVPKVALYWNWARLRQNLFLRPEPETELGWRLPVAWALLAVRYGLVLGTCWMTDCLTPIVVYTVVWIIPVWLLYPWSMIIQGCSEHTWLARRKPGEGAKLFLHRRLLNRFPFTPWTGIRNVIPFLFKVFTCDVFIKGFILCGALPLHGRHHTCPAESVELWPLERYRAADEYRNGQVTVPTYTSLIDAMTSVFVALSMLPPLNATDKGAEHLELQELALGM